MNPSGFIPVQRVNEIDQTLREIKSLLRLRMNGVTSTAMRMNGLNYGINFGLDAVNIREIASRYQPNQDLAEVLWNQQARECKILATLLYPREAFDVRKAGEWLEACFVPELIEQLIFNQLQHQPYAVELADSWIKGETELRRTAGYTLALRLLLKRTSLPGLQDWLTHSQADQSSENYQLALTAGRFSERALFQPEDAR